MEAHLPVPFRPGNTVVRKYIERHQDSNFNVSFVTLVDWKDSKGKLHERHTLFVKWINFILPAWSLEFAQTCRDIFNEVCSDPKATPKELDRRMEQRLFEEFGFKLPEQRYYVTVGIYPNLWTNGMLTPQGMWKTNYVHRDHIYAHLLYNILARPGRTFFIDNVCYNNGMGHCKGFLAARHYCEKLTEKIRSNPPSRETTPYQ